MRGRMRQIVRSEGNHGKCEGKCEGKMRGMYNVYYYMIQYNNIHSTNISPLETYVLVCRGKRIQTERGTIKYTELYNFKEYGYTIHNRKKNMNKTMMQLLHRYIHNLYRS